MERCTENDYIVGGLDDPAPSTSFALVEPGGSILETPDAVTKGTQKFVIYAFLHYIWLNIADAPGFIEPNTTDIYSIQLLPQAVNSSLDKKLDDVISGLQNLTKEYRGNH